MKKFPFLIVAFLVCQYVPGQERDFHLMGKWTFQDYANLYIEDDELIQKDIWQNRPRQPLILEFLPNDILTIENPIYPEEKQTALWEIDSGNSFLTITYRNGERWKHTIYKVSDDSFTSVLEGPATKTDSVSICIFNRITDDEPFLPTEQKTYQSLPGSREQPDQPSVLNLRRLDSSLTQTDTSTGTESGPVSEPATGTKSTSPLEGREGIVILWGDPSQGREPTYTPRPQIPAWVSEQGLRLQVVVSFVLTPQGVLRDVKVEQSSGYSDVDDAVLEALRRWKFRPVSSTRTVTGRVPYTIIPR